MTLEETNTQTILYTKPISPFLHSYKKTMPQRLTSNLSMEGSNTQGLRKRFLKTQLVAL